MPAFPENDAEIQTGSSPHDDVQLRDRVMEKYLKPGTQGINHALLHFTLAKRLMPGFNEEREK